MSATEVRTWPTIDEVDVVVTALNEAFNAVDGMISRCRGLMDEELVWERPSGVPVPSLTDIGALTRLVVEMDHYVSGESDTGAQLRMWQDHFKQLLESASTFEAWERRRRDA